VVKKNVFGKIWDVAAYVVFAGGGAACIQEAMPERREAILVVTGIIFLCTAMALLRKILRSIK
jgi:hypothetical protein